MKYVMAELNGGKKVPLVFPAFLVHSEMAAAFKQALRRHGFEEVKFVSAGEANLVGTGVDCSGSSETMKLTAAKEDGKVIEMYDYLHGM